jgi:DOPA 4,5-dioxygenase
MSLKSERNADGKSYYNPPTNVKSEAYQSFPTPITNGQRGGFDVHIYYMQVCFS